MPTAARGELPADPVAAIAHIESELHDAIVSGALDPRDTVVLRGAVDEIISLLPADMILSREALERHRKKRVLSLARAPHIDPEKQQRLLALELREFGTPVREGARAVRRLVPRNDHRVRDDHGCRLLFSHGVPTYDCDFPCKDHTCLWLDGDRLTFHTHPYPGTVSADALQAFEDAGHGLTFRISPVSSYYPGGTWRVVFSRKEAA